MTGETQIIIGCIICAVAIVLIKDYFRHISESEAYIRKKKREDKIINQALSKPKKKNIEKTEDFVKYLTRHDEYMFVLLHYFRKDFKSPERYELIIKNITGDIIHPEGTRLQLITIIPTHFKDETN